MVRTLLKWSTVVWVSIGSLLMLVAIAGALSNPRTNMGIGILNVSGRRSLLVSVPLFLAGAAGARLAAKGRRSGSWVVAASSLFWVVCLGPYLRDDFDPGIAVIAVLFTLTALWGLWTAVASRRPNGKAQGATS